MHTVIRAGLCVIVMVLGAPGTGPDGARNGSIVWAAGGALPAEQLLWIANEGLVTPGPPPVYQQPGDISIVSPGTGGVEVARLSLELNGVQGQRPIDTIFSPNGKTAYVAAQASGQVWVLDVRSRTAAAVVQIPSPEGLTNAQPHDLALSPNGKLLFAATLSDRFVPIVDTRTLQILGYLDAGFDLDTMTLPARTHIVAVAPDRRWLLTVNHNANTITFFDLRAIERDPNGIHTAVNMVQTGARPQHLAFTHSGRRFYVTAGLENQVEAYAFEARTGTATLTAETSVGSGPTFIALTPAGDRLIVTNTGVTGSVGNITVLDPRTLVELGTIGGVPRANHIAVSANGRTAFVTSGLQDFVAEIDIETFSIDQTIPVGREPHGVVVQGPGNGV
jgi:6-phosphogluconolactonase (cycloisomerase 2 family)